MPSPDVATIWPSILLTILPEKVPISLSRIPLPALMVPLLVMPPANVDMATDPGMLPV